MVIWSKVKVINSTGGMLSKPIYLNKIEDSGILCVKLKFTSIRRNTKSESVLTNAMLMKDFLQWVMIFEKGPENSSILMVSRNRTYISNWDYILKVLLHNEELFVRKYQNLLSPIIYWALAP